LFAAAIARPTASAGFIIGPCPVSDARAASATRAMAAPAAK
jgi:hypothetical protein